MEAVDGFMAKRDFQIGFDLGVGNEDKALALDEAVATVIPSYITASLTIEVYQPVSGDLHRIILEMCTSDIIVGCDLETIITNRREVFGSGKAGQIGFFYKKGRVSDHRVHMCADEVDSETLMVHVMTIDFEGARLETNVFATETDARRNAFELVPNCGALLSRK